jgi:hypothetical protein
VPRKLKVYSWTGTNTSTGSSSRQSRNIIAAHSIAEALQLSNTKQSVYKWSGGVTGNKEEVDAAMSRPYIPLWRPLDDREAEWREKRD